MPLTRNVCGVQVMRTQRRGRTLGVPFTLTVPTPHIHVHAVGVGSVGTDSIRESGRGLTVRTLAWEARHLGRVLRHVGLSTWRRGLAGAGAFSVTATFFTTVTGTCSKCVADFRTGRAVFFMRKQYWHTAVTGRIFWAPGHRFRPVNTPPVAAAQRYQTVHASIRLRYVSLRLRCWTGESGWVPVSPKRR